MLLQGGRFMAVRLEKIGEMVSNVVEWKTGTVLKRERPFLANSKGEKAKVLAKPWPNFCEIAALSQN